MEHNEKWILEKDYDMHKNVFRNTNTSIFQTTHNQALTKTIKVKPNSLSVAYS